MISSSSRLTSENALSILLSVPGQAIFPDETAFPRFQGVLLVAIIAENSPFGEIKKEVLGDKLLRGNFRTDITGFDIHGVI